MPLKLPVLKIGNNQVQRKKAIKFLGVMLDENMDWQEHIRTTAKTWQIILIDFIESNIY